MRASRPAPVLPQCSQAALNVISPRHWAAWGKGVAEEWCSSALLLVARPSNTLHVVLPGKGPRGEDGTLSVEEVPKDRVSVELYNAKMSQSVLFTF